MDSQVAKKYLEKMRLEISVTISVVHKSHVDVDVDWFACC